MIDSVRRIVGRPAFLAALACWLLLVGCSGLAAPEPPPTVSPASPTPSAVADRIAHPTAPAGHCATGRLLVGDIPTIAATWTVGVQDAIERAQTWRSDARLVILQIGCLPLEADFRWEGIFYSDSAQAFFASDTGVSSPAEVDPVTVPTLPLDRVSFGEVHRSLARAGYPDSAQISPTSGLTVRLNSPTDPFGPPGIPQDIVYHVAIEELGEARDLFITAANWTIYSYQDPR
ncbi:MAG: hypothetical protein IT337_11565 [Thermomicrobiales bacterium]|nr:hypothetical protein [Thermomicrobiales bacterium]